MSTAPANSRTARALSGPDNAGGPDDRKLSGWASFLEQFQKDAKLWLLCVAMLVAIRGVLLFLFRGQMAEESGIADIVAAVLTGLRFDSRVASFVIFPSLALSVLCLSANVSRIADRVRLTAGIVFLMFTVALGRIDIGYFREFHNQFDHFALGVLFDDMGAILQTVSKEYSLWRVAAVFVVFTVAGSFVTSWWLRRPFVRAERLTGLTAHGAVRVGLGLLVVFTVVSATRGSAGHRPVRSRDAAISADPFLNKIVLNPYSALRYAWKNHQDARGAWGIEKFLPGGDVHAAARLLVQREEPPETVADALLQIAKGPRTVPPRHVFVVAVESFDSWPLLDEYASLHLADNAKKLAREGIWVKSFVSGSGGSMSSFSALVTGFGDTGLVTNLQPNSRQAYETSLPDLFRRLGYRTRLFYAGSESRHRIGDFSREQGFEDILCGGTIGGMDGNEWGVNDAELFQFVLDTVNDDQPSFNFILTASNHPPYDVDVYEEGFPLREIPPEFADDFSRGNHSLLMLGHHWYADRSAGQFVDEVERRLPRVLVALTGDHWSRRYPGPRPGLYERTSVPLILYGPEVLEGVPVPDQLAGSHLDLGATLIELTAPEGFRYHSTGHDILDPEAEPIGFGRRVIIGPGFVLAPEKGAALEPIPGIPLTPDQDPRALLRRHQAIYGLSWWRVKNGSELREPTQR